jgi:protein tyrosine phosphatase
MGKIVCVFVMFWGNFVMSLVIVSLANLVDLNKKEAQVYF